MVKKNLEKLRQAMESAGIQAYIVPSSDPHQSEYVADRWKSREWLSGFTGSAGLLVVGLYEAGLWTDSRYFLQGEEELAGTGITLFKQGVPGTPSKEEWLISTLKPGDVVGCDGANFSLGEIRTLRRHLERQHLILEDGIDLLENIWDDRPPLPAAPVFEHDAAFAGQTRGERLAAVRKRMGEADGLFISTLDDIAWLLNIRGSDVECNPVAIAHCLVEKKRCYLFIGEGKVDKALEEKLLADGVHLRPYGDTLTFLKALSKEYHIIIDPAKFNAQLERALPLAIIQEEDNCPTIAMKAIKNPTEVGHIRRAMARDAVALLRLFKWLDEELDSRPVSEVEVSDQLIEFRKMGEHYYGESFPAIVGYRGNGAIVHYRPLPGKCARIRKAGILLLDSGGQYHDGTTDITRTVALGTPTDIQKRHFTLVLKGHIALATQHFPKGTTGLQLDTLTRQFLWKEDLNFGHGTGHGVGFFLNVHEGPQGIGPIPQGRYMEHIKEGMFTSNEPGLYITGEYGIRIENLILTVPADREGFLKFDTLTLFPIDLNLVDASLLTKEEKQWLNDYHQEVFDKVSPLLSDEGELAWLREKCGKV